MVVSSPLNLARSLDLAARSSRCSSLLFRRSGRRFNVTTASTKLDLKAIDEKWQGIWQKHYMLVSGRAQETSDEKKKSYILAMFPYPSGALHMGHLRVYTISDVLARFKQMRGFNVLHPMGWDAFGLPAENAAIERGIDPAKWTKSNIEKMKAQLSAMGGRIDWDKEFMTCDPDFYKFTQEIFLLLYERGFAYQKDALVNYDPVDKTVLANEQVDTNGCSWRSGAKVEQLKLKQWFLRITAFKEELLSDLQILSRTSSWPKRVISMQKHWIGRSSGTNVTFPVSVNGTLSEKPLTVFTTRPDTLAGVQYLALSFNHALVREAAVHDVELQKFIKSASDLPPNSKAGFLLQGVRAINPLTRLSNAIQLESNSVPVYVAPYVVDDYGEGAVMGVPAHDIRDHEFWRQAGHDGPIPVAIAIPSENKPSKIFLHSGKDDIPYVGYGTLTRLSGSFAGLTSREAARCITEELEKLGLGERKERWRLRDWLISRQRYWGTPIPIIHCDTCGTVPVPLQDLPVRLPELPEEAFKGKRGNPLDSVKEWVNVPCPGCGKPAKRETDTMDTFVDSSWYYLRFPDSHNSQKPFSHSATDTLPVDIYIGGIEHAILHLLYARFMYKFLATTALWPSSKTSLHAEPFSKLITQGMVHGKTYSDPESHRFLQPAELDLSDPSNLIIKANGRTPKVSYEKMSKSKHNGIDPTSCIETYGADVTRAHILFQAPVSEVLEWHEEKIVGIQRWFGRLWRLVCDIADSSASDVDRPDPAVDSEPYELDALKNSESAELWTAVLATISSVTTALDRTYSFNTLISDLIKLSNAITAFPRELNPRLRFRATAVLLRLMAPATPAFAEECWEKLTMSGRRDDAYRGIFTTSFPVALPLSAPIMHYSSTTQQPLVWAATTQNCAVQINGRVKFTVRIPVPKAERGMRDALVRAIEQTPQGKKWFNDNGRNVDEAKRVIIVKGGKLVNFVF